MQRPQGRTIWGTQHTVDLIDADDAALCRFACGQRHFQMNGNGTIPAFKGAAAQAPTKRPELFSQQALQLWSFALMLTAQNETDKARTA